MFIAIVMSILMLFIIFSAALHLSSWIIIAAAIVGGIIMIGGAFMIRAKYKDE